MRSTTKVSLIAAVLGVGVVGALAPMITLR
jgi:hypothetical protein